MAEPAPYHDDLDATLAECWRLLTLGARERRTAFHNPALATVGLDGQPRVRTVVLRDALAGTRSLRFHADRRSQKLVEIAREPRVTLHVYDEALKVQVRVAGRAAVHRDGPVADEAWAAARPMSRATYAVDPGPGTALAAGGGYAMPREEAAIDAARANFAAVAVEATGVEFLHLAHAGHRRARFTWSGTAWEGTWLVP